MGILTLTAALTGCVGVIGSGDGAGDAGPGGGSGNSSSLTCDESAIPDTAPLRRLSHTQYAGSVRDFLATALPKDGAAVYAEVAPKIDAMPDDRQVGPIGEIHGGFRRLDQAVNQEHVDGSYDVALAIGKAVANDPARLAAIGGACADAACVDAMIGKLGPIALRRPLDAEDVAFYRGFAGTDFSPAAIADVIAAMLVSPRFLYHVEHATTDEAFAPLDAWELAARLSYHFWQTAPDAELRDAAASGALLTDDGYRAQVDRMFADPKTQAALDDFFREWMWLEELPKLDARLGDVVFDAFVGMEKPTADLRDEMIADVITATRTVAQGGGTFSDLLGDTRAYVKSDLFARIYGVSPGSMAAPPDRAGLLTRPAFLTTGSANTRPIMKGVFIRKALLCDDIPPPPKNANATKPMLSGSLTTREVVEQLTEKPGSVCAGCHATMINPLGFATEDFDSLGRHRKAQKLFDDAGKLLTEKPVDTHTIPRVTPDDLRDSSGAADLTKYLLESGKVQTCFARQYFRFTFARLENDRDACAINAVTKGAVEGSTFGDVLKNIALRTEFKRRSF
ncbi:MAG: DUF1592 domain-containing protein [Polyangiales bacterium]